MAKRFTDTEKWKKRFIRKLEAPYKLLWLFICDDCDHAGIWHVDFDVAKIFTSCNVDEKTALKYFGEKVIPFDGGEKWFIPSFIEFQYGKLNPQNRAHNSVIEKLNKYDIKGLPKGLISPLNGAMDKDKDKVLVKDKVLDKEKEKNCKVKFAEFVTLTEIEYGKLENQYGKSGADHMVKILNNYKGSKGKRYKSDYLTILNWVVKRYLEEKEKTPNTEFDVDALKDKLGIKNEIP